MVQTRLLQRDFNSYEELSKSAIEAYDVSKLAQSKMIMVKEKATRDLGQYKTKMEELKRIIRVHVHQVLQEEHTG